MAQLCGGHGVDVESFEYMSAACSVAAA